MFCLFCVLFVCFVVCSVDLFTRVYLCEYVYVVSLSLTRIEHWLCGKTSLIFLFVCCCLHIYYNNKKKNERATMARHELTTQITTITNTNTQKRLHQQNSNRKSKQKTYISWIVVVVGVRVSGCLVCRYPKDDYGLKFKWS